MPKTKKRQAPSRSELMANVRRTGTAPELAVRRVLRLLRIPFKTQNADLPGSPDLADRSNAWAIFVHGCYWHRHAGCKRTTIPKSNRQFWLKKFADNVRRDRRKAAQLRRRGYRVYTIWECETFATRRLATRLLRLRKAPEKAESGDNKVRFTVNQERKLVSRILKTGKGEKRSSVRLSMATSSGDAALVFDRNYLLSRVRPRAASGPELRAVDLFAGCGGLSLGASEACRALGKFFHPVLALDASEHSLAVYRANFQPDHVAECDIWDVVNGKPGAPLTIAEKALRDSLGHVHLLLAGPPCQGYSDLNNHTRRNDERNTLYERVSRFARVVRPDHVIIENVPSVVHDLAGTYVKTKKTLERLGYGVQDGVIDLSQLGVAQLRRRHVLVGSLTKTIDLPSLVQRHGVGTWRTVRFAIGDLAREHRNGAFTRAASQSTANARRLGLLFTRDLLDLPDHARPACHQNGDHSYTAVYGRLLYDFPAPTITGGFGSPGQGRFIHPTQKRTLTPHEAARIQFFPDCFDFTPAKKRSHLAEMIGNAVPMKLAFAICLELLA